MRWEKHYAPAYTVAKVYLEDGESIFVEPNAYMLHRGDLSIETSLQGGFMGVLGRLISGENIFVNKLTANGSAEVWIAHSLVGDIEYLPLDGDKILVQNSSYVAHHGDVEYGIAFRPKGIIAEAQLFWLSLEGTGGVWVGGYGAFETIELGPGERITVDNFHLVAFDDTVKWEIKTFGGLFSTVFGGEGLVMELTGPGRVVVQTRAINGLLELIAKMLGIKKGR